MSNVSDWTRSGEVYLLLDGIGVPTDELHASFPSLKADDYLQGAHKFRYRAFSEAAVTNGAVVEWRRPAVFSQSREINTYLGGVDRHYSPIAEAARQFAAGIIQTLFARGAISAGNFLVGVHQIRVVATRDFEGQPAPEGFHRDGFDYVYIHCVAKANVDGGISMISDGSGERVVFEKLLLPGEALLINDEKAKHYVSPIRPLEAGDAVRDVVVMTFARQRAGHFPPPGKSASAPSLVE